jgi:hypothetical protein
MSITDPMLMAYADGELDAADRKVVEDAIAADASLAAALARHQALRQALAGAFNPVIEEPVPQRLLEAVTAHATKSAAPRLWLPLAACLVVGLVLGAGLPRPTLIGPDMAAHGALGKALERQTAADGQAGAVIRIGLTFREKDGGRFCRTFQAKAMAGLACREGAGWRVRMAVPDQVQSGDFRTAGGLPSVLMDQVQATVDGPPLDAAGERAALATHWRR